MVAANRPSLNKASLNKASLGKASLDKASLGKAETKGEESMRSACAFAVAMLALTTICSAAYAAEPKQGGIFRIYHRDSPGSASIHEGATYSVNIPFMPVFNNLVIYDQNVAQNSMESIVPDLAESWAWSEDQKTLTFKLRQGVKWHDGKPFTSADVKCTFDMLMGKSQQKFRQNPRKSWYDQVNDVTANGDFEVSFNLKRPQPSLLALLASGYTPVYPCHVSPGDMRTHPIGTGPFKFVEFKANESIKLTKNPDYFKKGLPHLDGIEFTIITNRSTAILGFVAGKFDMTFPTHITIPLLKDLKSQAPNAICVVEPTNVSTNIIVNSSSPPFDNVDVRRAMALALDRKEYMLGLNLTGNAVDDPDQSFYENYSCGSERNYTNYCNKEIEKLIDQQSVETDVAKRKKMVWDIDKKLQEDVARPIIFHARAGTCWQPYVKGVTVMVNSSYNGYRYEDVWLDR